MGGAVEDRSPFLAVRPVGPVEQRVVLVLRHEQQERSRRGRIERSLTRTTALMSAFAGCGQAALHALLGNGPATDSCTAANVTSGANLTEIHRFEFA
jgi:hypothetical protein